MTFESFGTMREALRMVYEDTAHAGKAITRVTSLQNAITDVRDGPGAPLLECEIPDATLIAGFWNSTAQSSEFSQQLEQTYNPQMIRDLLGFISVENNTHAMTRIIENPILESDQKAELLDLFPLEHMEFMAPKYFTHAAKADAESWELLMAAMERKLQAGETLSIESASILNTFLTLMAIDPPTGDAATAMRASFNRVQAQAPHVLGELAARSSNVNLLLRQIPGPTALQ